MAVHAGARLLAAHHKNPVGISLWPPTRSASTCFLAQRRWMCSHRITVLPGLATTQANREVAETVLFSWEMRNERSCCSPKCTGTSTKVMPLQCPCIVPHLAAVLSSMNAESKHIGPATTTDPEPHRALRSSRPVKADRKACLALTGTGREFG